MPRKHPRDIHHSEVIRECEKWPTNIIWPAPIDVRLNALVDRAIQAGEPDTLSRSELLAALVLAAPSEGEELTTILRTYRKAKVAQCMTAGSTSNGNVITLEARRPGRR